MQEVELALNPWTPGAFSLGVYVLMVLVLAGVLLFLSYWLNPARKTAVKGISYECGVVPTGQAHFSYPTPFYLVATFFLIFDVETVYVFTWAVSFHDLGMVGWLRMTFFIGVLFLSLCYICRKGGLDWGKA